MTDSVVRFDGVDIVFGPKPEAALPLIDAGQTRSQIQTQTGQILGVAQCTLDVAAGEVLVLMGLSGSGKSTLLRAVNALNSVVRGAVMVRATPSDDWLDPHTCSAAELRALRLNTVSMVFQQFGLLPWRSVAENVGFGLELAGVRPSAIRHRVAQQLELVGLADWADRPVQSLSGGMQQRVGLARAFVTEAPILLMDEPYSALDPLIRARLQDELLALQAQLNRTIVFVSHDLDEAIKIGTRIAIMDGGRIVQCGTAQDILNAPANQYVADFVAHMNPLAVLTARDAMRELPAGAPTHAGALTVARDAPLRDVMRASVDTNLPVYVEHNGARIGIVDSTDLQKALLRD
ncbi:MAG: choline ABC transporter ATP-binding protein [Gammaproteobacteria bacterium]|nr:choline ABC transporter ATP-binding protein [Gammaproteobacteria bacterium]